MPVYPRNTLPANIYYSDGNNIFYSGQTFDITFEYETSSADIDSANNLVVKYFNTSTKQEVLLVLDEDYEVISNKQYVSSDVVITPPIEGELGIFGSIRLLKRLDNASRLIITRQIEVSQLLDFNYNDISTKDIGMALDKLTMIAQDQQHTSGNVRMPIDQVVMNNINGDISLNSTPNSLLGIKDDPSKIEAIALGSNLKFVDEKDSDGNLTGRRLLVAEFSNFTVDPTTNSINVFVVPQRISVGENMTMTTDTVEDEISFTPKGNDSEDDLGDEDTVDDEDNNNQEVTYTSNIDRVTLNTISPQTMDGENILLIQPIIENGKRIAWGFGTNLENFKATARDAMPPLVTYKGGKFITIGREEGEEEEGQRSFVVQYIRDNITTLLDAGLREALLNFVAEDEEDALLIQQILQDGHVITNWGANEIVKILLPLAIEQLPWWLKSVLPADLQNLSDKNKILTIKCTLQNGNKISIDDDGHINLLIEPSDTVRFEATESNTFKVKSPKVTIATDSQDVLSCEEIPVDTEQEVSNNNPIDKFELSFNKTALAESLSNDIKVQITNDLDFKNSLKGDKGDPGENGHSPVIDISQDGHLIIDGVDKGSIKGEQGEAGLSPVVDVNLDGHLFINGIDKGRIKGEKGDKGDTPVITINQDSHLIVDNVDKGSIKGQKGEPGDTPVVEVRNNYLYINNENTGLYLKGDKGDPGQDGHSPVIDISQDGHLIIDGVDKGQVIAQSLGGTTLQFRLTSTNGDLNDPQPVYDDSTGKWIFDLSITDNFKDALKGQIKDELISELQSTSGTSSGTSSGSGGTTVNVTLPEIKTSINNDINQTGSDINNSINQVAEKAAERFVNNPDSNMYHAPNFIAGDNIYLTGGYGVNVDENGNVTPKNDTDEGNWFTWAVNTIEQYAPSILKISSVAFPEYAPLINAVSTFMDVLNLARQEQSVGAWYNAIPDALFGNSSFLGGIVKGIKDFLSPEEQANMPNNPLQLDKQYNANKNVFTWNARDFNFSGDRYISVQATENGKRSTDVSVRLNQATIQEDFKGEKGDKGDPGESGGASFGIQFDPNIVINNIGYDTDISVGGDAIGNGGSVINNTTINDAQTVQNKSSLFTLLHNATTQSTPTVSVMQTLTSNMIKVFNQKITLYDENRVKQYYINLCVDKQGKLYGITSSEVNDVDEVEPGSFNLLGNLLPDNLSVIPEISDVSFCPSKNAFLLVASNVNQLYLAYYSVSNYTITFNSQIIDTSSYCPAPYGQDGGQCSTTRNQGYYAFYVAPSNGQETGSLLEIKITDINNPIISIIEDFNRSTCSGSVYHLTSAYIQTQAMGQYSYKLFLVTQTGNIFVKSYGTYAHTDNFSIAQKVFSNSSYLIQPLGIIKYGQTWSNNNIYNVFIFFKYKTNLNSTEDWVYSCLGLTGIDKQYMILDENVTIPSMSNIVYADDMVQMYRKEDEVFFDDQGQCFTITFNAHESSVYSITNNKILSVRKVTSDMPLSYDAFSLPSMPANDRVLLGSDGGCIFFNRSGFKYYVEGKWTDTYPYAKTINIGGNFAIIKTKYIFNGYISALVNFEVENNTYQFLIWTENGGRSWKQKQFVLGSNYIDYVNGNDGVLFIPQSGRTYVTLTSLSGEFEYKEISLDTQLTFDNTISAFALKNKYIVIKHSTNTVGEISVLERTTQGDNIIWTSTDYSYSDAEDHVRIDKSPTSIGYITLDNVMYPVIVAPITDNGFIFAIGNTVSFDEEYVDVQWYLDSYNNIKLSKPVFDGKDLMAILVHEYEDETEYRQSQIAVYKFENYYGTIDLNTEPLTIDVPSIAGYTPKRLMFARNNQQWALFYEPSENNKNIIVCISDSILTFDTAQSYEIMQSSKNIVGDIDLEMLSFNQFGYFVAGSNNFMFSVQPMTLAQTIMYLSAQTELLQKKERETLITDIETLNSTITNLQNQIATLTTNYNNLLSAVDTQNENTANLENEISGITNDIQNSISTRVSNLENSTNTLKSTADNHTRKLDMICGENILNIRFAPDTATVVSTTPGNIEFISNKYWSATLNGMMAEFYAMSRAWFKTINSSDTRVFPIAALPTIMVDPDTGDKVIDTFTTSATASQTFTEAGHFISATVDTDDSKKWRGE